MLNTVGRFKDAFSLFIRSHSEWGPFAEGISFSYQDYKEEEEGEDSKVGHYSIYLANSDNCNLVIDIKVDRETKEKTYRVNWNYCLNGIALEALGLYWQLVYYYRID